MKSLYVATCVLLLGLSSAAVAGDPVVPSAATDAKAVAPGADKVKADAKAAASSAATGGFKLSITNPMTHDMTVSADWGHGLKELGSVKPGETKLFDIAAAAGTQINLVATDTANTHNSKGTLTLDANAPAAWTIQ